MQVRRELCSGSTFIEHFMCPICDKLVVDMLIHDGGYNQPFCQKPFCTNCLTKMWRVTDKSFVGPLKKRVFKCPVVGCTIPLQQPMVRAAGPAENYYYKRIMITCESCQQRMGPYLYENHPEKCPGKPLGVIELVDGQGPLLENPNSSDDSLFEKNLLSAGNSSPDLIGKATYARYFTEPRRMVFGVSFARKENEVRINSDEKYDQLLTKMRTHYNFAVCTDLVNIEIKELGKNLKIDEFLADINVGAPLNVCRASNWTSEQSKVQFCYIQGVNKDDVKTGQKVFPTEAIEE
ncbi:uncharacterized protein LOC112539811 [Tetranychus urticae]|uniref:Uncharacterized protein n=1 Tax=Tetranychus urticae TaxID=32264 RepID=T1KG87_TETUR|nr:uncharacterized protein LOC112539811 [Tetranychus urticae]